MIANLFNLATVPMPLRLTGDDGWIILAAVLCAMACALPGSFLVLRRMSMMGDALSHAVLPGLAVAFLLTGSRSGPVMLIGAAVVGVITALLTQLITSLGKVEESASMGVVFTTLFALGLVLIRMAADHVDLDPGCVLYGAIETVPLDMVRVGGLHLPRVVLILSVTLLVNTLLVLVFYKELKVSSFDPALATTLGINANLMHYLLMTVVAATTVASFEAAGSILVVAMLIVPGATALLLTQRLGPMLLISLVIAAMSGVLGHVGAITLPRAFGYADTNTSGMMSAAAGLLFLLALLFAPRQGVLSRIAHRMALSVRIAAEDVLGQLYRFEEAAGNELGQLMPLPELESRLTAGAVVRRLAIESLRRRGRVVADATGCRLTPVGRDEARRLLGSHRLWETYFAEQVQVRPDHTHRPAEELEHVTTQTMRQELRAIAQTDTSPQGKPIPKEG